MRGLQGSGRGLRGTPKSAKHGSIASLEELESAGKAQTKKQMEWASGRYAARCAQGLGYRGPV